MKKMQVMEAAIILIASSVYARTNTLLKTATDWTRATSYQDETFVPGNGDVVVLEEGGDFAVTSGTANWDKMNSWQRIVQTGENCGSLSVCVADEAETATLAPALSSIQYPGVKDFIRTGALIKTGPGTLLLGSTLRIVKGNPTCDAYDLPITVTAGRLAFSPIAGDADFDLTVGRLTIAEGATFVMPCAEDPASSDKVVNFRCAGIQGGGVFKSEDTRSGKTSLYLFGDGKDEAATFSGTLTGKFTFNGGAGSDQTVSGQSPDYLGNVYPQGGTLRATVLGGTTGLSSFGLGDYYWFSGSTGGRVVNAGGPQSCSRQIVVGMSASPSGFPTLDAGAQGGLVVDNRVIHPGYEKTLQQVLCLSGEGTAQPSVLSAAVEDTWADADGNPLNIRFLKRGAGTWLFPERTSGYPASSFAVEEGALRYGSIAEPYGECSLGYGTNLCELYVGTYDATKLTDVFLTLGGTRADAPGTLEFCGTESQTCEQRPIAVTGTGVFKNGSAGGATIRWRDFRAKTAGSTLVLDGGAAMTTNEVADISGAMNVTKRGQGIWRISGDLTFSGRLSVDGGKLIVRKLEPDQPFTWFRWTWRQLGTAGDATAEVQAMGLFDKEDQPVAFGLTEAVNSRDPQPGECAFSTRLTHNPADNRNDELTRVFSSITKDWGFCGTFYRMNGTTSRKVTSADPHSAVSVVMHLADGKNEAISWDYCNVWSTTHNHGVTSSLLEGSIDGLHWETAYDAPASDTVAYGNTWTWNYGGKDATWPNASMQHRSNGLSLGKPLTRTRTTKAYDVLDNCTGVSVAAGAELVADGQQIQISSIVVRPDGNGTLDGFALADAGTVELDDDLAPGVRELTGPLLKNPSGATRLQGWALRVGGAENSRYDVRVKDGRIMVSRRGMVLIVR